MMQAEPRGDVSVADLKSGPSPEDRITTMQASRVAAAPGWPDVDPRQSGVLRRPNQHGPWQQFGTGATATEARQQLRTTASAARDAAPQQPNISHTAATRQPRGPPATPGRRDGVQALTSPLRSWPVSTRCRAQAVLAQSVAWPAAPGAAACRNARFRVFYPAVAVLIQAILLNNAAACVVSGP